MRFRFYIIENEGTTGTNSVKVAEAAAISEGTTVIDAEAGVELQAGQSYRQIQENVDYIVA